MTATGEVRTIAARIGIGTLAADVELVVLGVEESHVDVGCGLDAVVAIAGTLAILHLRSIGVGTDVGVAFPAVHSCLIACSVRTIVIDKVDVDELTQSCIVAIQIVESRSQGCEVTERRHVLVVAQRHVRAMTLAVGVVDITTDFQVFVYLGADISTGRETLVVSVDNKTIDVVVTEREVVLGLVVATIEGNAVLLLEGCTGHLLLPVDFLALAIILLIPNLVDEHIRTLGQTDSLGIIIEVKNVKRIGQSLDTPVGGHGDVGMTL